MARVFASITEVHYANEGPCLHKPWNSPSFIQICINIQIYTNYRISTGSPGKELSLGDGKKVGPSVLI